MSFKDPTPPKEIEKNPAESAIKLLQHISWKFEQLINESDTALTERDTVKYQADSLQAAELIRDLPVRLETALQ
ncbi:MAG TPA: hypothetical protein VFQ60_04130 [Patescibacteria group bacterium]|nr:hypothetical protein [Patescibacteria group bacterium]